MPRLTGRWIAIGIAALIAAVLTIYAAAGASRPRPAPATDLPIATQPTAAPAVQTIPGMSAGALVGTVLKVGIVAALLAASLWALRRFGGAATRPAGRTGAVTVADTIPLAKDRAVYVLNVGGRSLVVGATAQQLSLLAEITDLEMIDRLHATPERPGVPLAGISQGLQSLLKQVTARPAPARAARSERTAIPPEPRRSRVAAAAATLEGGPVAPSTTETFAALLRARQQVQGLAINRAQGRHVGELRDE